jgi:uncharacterized protein YbjT (DUF2867 family)
MSDTEKEHTMRVFARGASGAAGTRLVSQLTVHGHKVTGTYRSPRKAGRVRALGAEPIALGQQPARAWRRIAGGS